MQQSTTRQSQVNFKKAAFRGNIRRQWLDRYFSSKREQLMIFDKKRSQHQEQLNCKFSQILDNLPDSNAVQLMIIEHELNKHQLLKYLKSNIMKLTDTIGEISLKAFNIYIMVLNGVIVFYPDQKQQVLELSLRRMISQGRRLMKEQRTNAPYIIENLVELILLLSQTFPKMDQLLVSQIGDVLTDALNLTHLNPLNKDLQQNYLRSLEIINQFLSASVSGADQEQDQQNIDQNEQRDLQYSKKCFICKMFRQNPKNIKTLLNIGCSLFDDLKIVMITLKVLTNLTYHSSQLAIYYQLFDSNIEHLIFCSMTNYPQKQNLMIILVRLINNLLLFSKNATECRIQNMHIKLLVKIFQNQKHGKVNFVEQFCVVFANLAIFMDQITSVIKYFIDKKVVDALIYGCEHITNQQLLFQILISFTAFIKVQRQTVTAKIRLNQHIFIKIVEQQNQQASSAARNLLEECFGQKETYSRIESQQIQI